MTEIGKMYEDEKRAEVEKQIKKQRLEDALIMLKFADIEVVIEDMKLESDLVGELRRLKEEKGL